MYLLTERRGSGRRSGAGGGGADGGGPRTPQAAGPVARAAPFLPCSAATDRRTDGGGPVEARVVVPPGAARVVLPWRGVSPLRDTRKWRRPLPGRGWKRRRRKEKGGLGLLAGPPSNGLSRATAHGATQSRQCMWRDSVLPRQVRWHTHCQRGTSVAPKHMA